MLWCNIVLPVCLLKGRASALGFFPFVFVCCYRFFPLSSLKKQNLSPDTTRPMGERDVDGRGYFFTDRETMERDIRENKFLDYGEFDGELYGIKFSTVRAIIKTGRVCVMAVSPSVSSWAEDWKGGWGEAMLIQITPRHWQSSSLSVPASVTKTKLLVSPQSVIL